MSPKEQILKLIKNEEEKFLKNNPEKKISKIILIGSEDAGSKKSIEILRRFEENKIDVVVINLNEEQTKELENFKRPEPMVTKLITNEILPMYETPIIEDILGREKKEMKIQQKFTRNFHNKNFSKTLKRK